jgi:D-beta-D-heptose 7-phosphate kinase/D-beta-D-heptose 1-phosphate adenosyltransferase
MTKILVNGAFDILHTGHIDLINYAKSLGDHLIVALDSDRRIKQNKGDSRPINDSVTRLMIMKNLKAVDQVVLFDNDDQLITLIKEVDIRVIGSDWKDKEVVGRQYCKQLVFYDRVKDESTTKTIENIINRR